MKSSNPVLNRMLRTAVHDRSATGAPQYGYGQPGYGQGYYSQHQYGYTQPAYPQGAYPTTPGYVSPPRVDTMTLDDVIIRTVGLLALTGLVGAFGWLVLPRLAPGGYALVPVAVLVTLGIAIYSWFRPITNPVVAGVYAAAQGLMLGLVSRVFEHAYSGIVLQAVVGTFGIFAVMAVLYHFKVLRATPRFTKFLIGALIGVLVLSLFNWLMTMFGHNPGLIQYDVTGKVSWLPIVFSLACVVIGALSFVLDFAMVEEGVRAGAPRRYAWACAFGLLVGLIYLYWQLLRLLGYLRR